MPVIDIFEHTEFLKGGAVHCYDGKKVISSVAPEAVGFASFAEIPKAGGCCIRFISDSPVITINYTITQPQIISLPNIGITVSRGLSYCFRALGEKNWNNMDCFDCLEKSAVLTVNMSRFYISENEKYEFMIFLPVSCFASEFKITVADNAVFQPYEINSDEKKNAVMLGGFAGYGFGAVVAQMMLCNLLAKSNDHFEMKNLSFYTRNAWNYYEKMLDETDECFDADFIFTELLNSYISIEDFRKVFPLFMEKALTKTNANMILWFIPCMRKDIDLYLDEAERFIKSKGCENRVTVCSSLIVNGSDALDRYTFSKNFMNDYGHIFVMQEINKVLREKWNI